MSSLAAPGAGPPEYLWRDGSLVRWSDALVHVSAVGHGSVSSVFEGIKAYWNADHQQLYVFRPREHLERLARSLRVVRLEGGFTPEALLAATRELLRANQARRDTYVRPWCFAGGNVYEGMLEPGLPTETVIDCWPFQSGLGRERGCRVFVSSWTRIADNVMPPRVKAFSNYHSARFGVIEARVHGHDWPLFLNDRHQVSEGPVACVALVRDGAVITPPVSSGLLESVTRATVLELLGGTLGVPVIEREVERTELYLAEELFFMGTGWEILPILAVDGLQVGDGCMGPTTRAVEQAYQRAVRGEDEHEAWRTPVW